MTKLFLSILFLFSISILANADNQKISTLKGQDHGFLDDDEPYPQQVIIDIERRVDSGAASSCMNGVVTRISNYDVKEFRYDHGYRHGQYVVVTAFYSCNDNNSNDRRCEEECSGLIGQWGYSACLKSCKNGTGDLL